LELKRLEAKMKNLVVGVAGHIDHGKTSLVKSLTGIDTDRLPEEKERNLSIEPGFAHLFHPPLSFDFVDIPGHGSYLHNALRSLWGIDLAILVVAANDGVMPQTKEHLEVLKILEVREGFVVLTKCDLADKEMIFSVQEEVKELVKGSFLEEKPIIEFSLPTEKGKAEIIKTLCVMGEKLEKRRDDKLFRFFVDRSFVSKGKGVIATGLVTSGELHLKEKVQIYPGEEIAVVKNLHRHGKEVERVKRGERAGINLSCESKFLKRGAILGRPGELFPTSIINAHIKLSYFSCRPLYHQEKVYFYHLSQKAKGRVFLLEKKRLNPGESSPVQIRLDSPIVPFFNDPIIIRFLSPSLTAGGGVIIDTHPPKLRKGKLWFLNRTSLYSSEERVILTPLTRSFEKSASQISRETGFKKEKIKEKALTLIKKGEVKLLSAEVYVKKEKFFEAYEILDKALEEIMEKNIFLPPMSREELFTRLSPPFSYLLYEFLLNRLIEEGKLKPVGEKLKIPSRKMPRKFIRVKEEILKKLKDSPPVREGELISIKGFSSKEIFQVLNYLLKEGEIVKLKDGAYTGKREFKKALEILLNFLEREGKITVKEAKGILQWGRRATITFLEHLDYLKITQRKGDYRILLGKEVSSQSL
jgi:selenocysteine-specific elongation factor